MILHHRVFTFFKLVSCVLHARKKPDVIKEWANFLSLEDIKDCDKKPLLYFYLLCFNLAIGAEWLGHRLGASVFMTTLESGFENGMVFWSPLWHFGKLIFFARVDKNQLCSYHLRKQSLSIYRLCALSRWSKRNPWGSISFGIFSNNCCVYLICGGHLSDMPYSIDGNFHM